jgi:DNA polymerase
MISYQRHCRKWQACTRCLIAEYTETKVLYRGTTPCNLLIVGEAPGDSELALNKPFIGPSGKLLNKVIAEAIAEKDAEVQVAYTNAVACAPFNDNYQLRPPTLDEIENCSVRLAEYIQIAQPIVIVGLGNIAKKALQRLGDAIEPKVLYGVHPAAILRQGERGSLDLARLRETIDEAIEYILNFPPIKSKRHASQKS